MSLEVPDDYDLEEHKQELYEKTANKRQEDSKRHNELLDAVAEGEEFDVEKYEWVELGGVELKVKAWFPGGTIDKLTALGDEPESGKEASNKIHGALDALIEMTEAIRHGDTTISAGGQIRGFYLDYYERWGDQGLMKAAEAVISPAESNADREEVMQSFRKTGRGDGPRRSR